MTEPRTAAGRALLDVIVRGRLFDNGPRQAILAIEAEARAEVYREIGELSELHAEAVAAIRAAALDEARAAVEQYIGAGPRKRILAAIDALREGAEPDLSEPPYNPPGVGY